MNRNQHNESRPVGAAQQRMGTISDLLRNVDREVVRLLESHVALEEQLASRDRTITELHQRVQELTRRVDELTAEKLRACPEVSTADDLRHSQLADRLDAFLKQDLPSLVRALTEHLVPVSPVQGQQQLAGLTGRIILELFVKGVSEPAVLLSTLKIDPVRAEFLTPATRVCTVATQLRATAEELGNATGWVLSFAAGTPIDPAIQTAWRGCDPAAPVAFAVTPGYCTPSRIYRHQEVFTRI